MGMFFSGKERERYYLLPGMGGRAMRRKHRFMLWWGVGVGTAISLALVALMLWLNK